MEAINGASALTNLEWLFIGVGFGVFLCSLRFNKTVAKLESLRKR